MIINFKKMKFIEVDNKVLINLDLIHEICINREQICIRFTIKHGVAHSTYRKVFVNKEDMIEFIVKYHLRDN